MEKLQNLPTSNAATITISSAEYSKFQTLELENTELKQQNEWLMQQLHLAKNRMFGSSSERASEEVMGQLSLLFNEAEVYCAQKQEPEETKVAAHTRKKRSGSVQEAVPDDIETVVVEHTLPEEELVCPQCGEMIQVIGKEVRRTLELEPAKARVREDWYYKYACQNCNQNDIQTPVVEAPREPALIPGGFASAKAVAHIMVEKFVMYAPLYRQELYWNKQGIMLSRQTMSNWLIYCGEHYLEPVYEELHRQLVQDAVLHADETTLQVLKEPGKKAHTKSYMWLYRTSGDAAHPIVLYEYQPDRKQEHPKEFLFGFHGYLQTDGYDGYHAVENVTHIGCWAHARRKFDEAVKCLPKGKKTGSAVEGQAYCSRLFAMEEELKDLSPDERKQQRLEQEKPVLDAMLAWANIRTAAPKSALGKALTYLKNQWVPLTNYLLDGRIELSNNRAERSIKPFVMGRKNFLFANTPAGASCSAVIYSLIETAKENKLDPYRYLSYVLNTAPGLDRNKEDWMLSLLPWNAPEDCKAPEGKGHAPNKH